MAGSENKKINNQFPPFFRKINVFSEKKIDHQYTNHHRKKGRVEEAPMTKKIIGWDV
jgi:hypothetical protein